MMVSAVSVALVLIKSVNFIYERSKRESGLSIDRAFSESFTYIIADY